MKQSLIAGIVLFVIGLALCVFPAGVWKIAEKWKSHGADQPSAGFRIVCRIVGIVFMAVGILLFAGVIE